MTHFLQCIIAGLLVILIGVVFMARYSRSKDPEEEKREAKVKKMNEDDDYPSVRKVQNN